MQESRLKDHLEIPLAAANGSHSQDSRATAFARKRKEMREAPFYGPKLILKAASTHMNELRLEKKYNKKSPGAF